SRAAVRMEALTALGEVACPPGDAAETVREAAAALTEEGGAWQVAAQALRSLARLDPDEAARLLPRFAGHRDPFVRAHAARVAATLEDRRTLGPLSVDESANVRSAAIEGLFELQGHGIDPLLRAHLVSDDPWLLLTTARLLSGAPEREETAEAALTAFERISEARRETWRDPRRALLALVGEMGGPAAAPEHGATRATPTAGDEAPPADSALAERLRPYLTDHDPLVAADVAAILAAWTGEPHEPAPEPLPRVPFPSIQEVDRLEHTTVTLHMRDLGPIVIRPLPHAAVTNAARFVRLAERGYYDGLTFHRHAPNFVIQGGSPGANEYAGDGPYTRDEIEHPHWRGTVGLSTRGRDTGDAQIFINLVHNLRLDADYTVFGEVIEGMEVADRVLEGALIERAEVRVEAGATP
ncbi:MAG TPA: peptidylprolyl isomerase, partial [Longimicrobiales bacterium]|nr:peptidylprolyl isomerase [Longimicrobiales bacterium]